MHTFYCDLFGCLLLCYVFLLAVTWLPTFFSVDSFAARNWSNANKAILEKTIKMHHCPGENVKQNANCMHVQSDALESVYRCKISVLVSHKSIQVSKQCIMEVNKYIHFGSYHLQICSIFIALPVNGFILLDKRVLWFKWQ